MALRPALHTSITAPVIDTKFTDSLTQGGHSLYVLWEKAYLCPCRNPTTEQPDPSCPRCFGTGVAYFPPEKIRCIIQSQARGVTNGQLGFTDSGLAYGTPDRAEASINGGISFRDRLTLSDVQISQSFIYNVTQARVDNGMYLYYDIHFLDYATSYNHGELKENTDYTIDINENRMYPKAELMGDNVSINMRVTLRYLVVDLLKESRYEYKDIKQNNQIFHQFISLPKKLLLRREDAFVSSQNFSLGKGDDNNFVDPKVQPQITVNPGDLSKFFKGFGN